MEKDLRLRDAQMLWHPYTQHKNSDLPLAVKHAKGAYIYDEAGRGYLDMISSWWVNLHGHGREELVAAIAQQARQLDHVHFAGLTHESAVELAQQLLELADLGEGARVFYSDNGSTAVEVALKICYQYWFNQGIKKPKILTLRGAYHGDTVGAMSAGFTSGYFDAFRRWMFEVEVLDVPHRWWGDCCGEDEGVALEKLKEILARRGGEIAAFILEPLIQGAAGMKFHSREFLAKACQLAQDSGIPVIFDEVMTGFYRTGTFFAFQQVSVSPDLLCLSKGITGGILPLGATIAKKKYFDVFLGETFATALAHGHSFTANPISCAAALASLRLLKSREVVARIQEISELLKDELKGLQRRHAILKPRALGDIAAFEMPGVSSDYATAGARPLARFAQDRGVLLRPMANNVYLMPPYCVSDSDIKLVFGVIDEYLCSHGK